MEVVERLFGKKYPINVVGSSIKSVVVVEGGAMRVSWSRYIIIIT